MSATLASNEQAVPLRPRRSQPLPRVEVLVLRGDTLKAEEARV